MTGRGFQFEWDEIKATANARKHGITFDLARTIFHDPRVLTIADLVHSDVEDRWISIGYAANGALLSVVHLWLDTDLESAKVRLVSARKATQAEIRYYQVGL